MLNKKILIVTSDTGGGHTSAAKAIEAGLAAFAGKLQYLVHITRIIEEAHFLGRQAVHLYNFLLRHYQSYVKYYHWAINKLGPDRSLYRFYRKSVEQLISRFCPNMIVSVHPMVQYGLACILQELKLLDRVPLVTVVTDPCGNSWRGWASEKVKLYIVAHEEAKAELVSFGISEDRIRVCGMPVHPKFEEAVEKLDKAELRRELGLDEKKFTVFINAGWVGGGNIPKVFEAIADANLDIQAIFLAGRNLNLLKRAQRVARRAKFPVRVLGYSENMERLMCSSDVMVSKLGGLTTFEALTCRLPIIIDHITPPMPQEAGTSALLERHCAGVRLERAADIVPIVRRLLHEPAEYLKMRAGTSRIVSPGATRKVIATLSDMIAPEGRLA
ncbi:MAG: hypothetical protein RMM17_01655 [Acidobacteriota bacterium]|nr:hypothetical protein [Blastocatellia bacterium]MDW8411375.1 hypothetical protein [Acidobacteriota bacterium]